MIWFSQVVDVSSVLDGVNLYQMLGGVDAVGSAARRVETVERLVQRLGHPVGVRGDCSLARWIVSSAAAATAGGRSSWRFLRALRDSAIS
jgi:hypothetical protein